LRPIGQRTADADRSGDAEGQGEKKPSFWQVASAEISKPLIVSSAPCQRSGEIG
jgi:hypothetical protein